MLSWLIMPKAEIKEPVVKPSTETLDHNSLVSFGRVLDYANSLRTNTKPDMASQMMFITAMAKWKGWKAESLAGIAAFLKSQGFHEVVGKNGMELVNYESGIHARVGGDPHKIERLEAAVLFCSDSDNGPLHRVSLTPDSGVFSIGPVASALEIFKEKMSWFKSKRRR